MKLKNLIRTLCLLDEDYLDCDIYIYTNDNTLPIKLYGLSVDLSTNEIIFLDDKIGGVYESMEE